MISGYKCFDQSKMKMNQRNVTGFVFRCGQDNKGLLFSFILLEEGG